MSNLIVDQLARELTAAAAVTHTLVMLGAIYALEHATSHHTSEFQRDKRESAALMARLQESYRENEGANKEPETTSKVLNVLLADAFRLRLNLKRWCVWLPCSGGRRRRGLN